MISVKKDFGNEVLDILNNNKYAHISSLDRGFVSIDNIIPSSLLFMGINPSFTNEATPNELNYYDIDPQNSSYKGYFGKFADISKYADMSWGHMDLLYFRETHQNQIDEMMQFPNGPSFIMSQLEVSKKILEAVNPKVLIVCNTKARQFLGKDKANGQNVWLGYDFEFDDDIGTYRIINNSLLNKTPVFFTSMLSGQRALDTGSYERLKWHIRMVLGKSSI
jgi:hypothetical protein